MKKNILLFIYIISVAFFSKLYGQDNRYCTINVIAYTTKENSNQFNETYKLYINEKFITDFIVGEIVKVNIPSEGNIDMKVLWGNENSKATITAKKGDIYNFCRNASVKNYFRNDYYFKLEKGDINTTINNLVIGKKEIFENKDNPWIPSSKYNHVDSNDSFSILRCFFSNSLWGSNPSSASFYINDYLVANMKTNQQLNLKIFSKGRINITMISASGRITTSVVLNENKEFFIEPSFFGGTIEEITKEKFSELSRKKNSDIDIEEDINHPWGKIDETKKSGKGQGTCFLISDKGYFITNYHCIENAKEVTIKGIDEDFTTKYGATIVATDPSNDLALLKINNKNVRFDSVQYGIKTIGVNQAEKIYALGFPSAEVMGTELKITDGIISAKSGAQGDISKFQISAPVNPGNSGGPLIDENGDLIGVIYAKSKIAEAVGYAIKASYLDLFLKNVEGFEMPVLQNKIKNKTLTDKVAYWKKNIFIVETN